MMIGSRIALSVLCAAALLLTPASLPTTPAALAQVTQGNQGLQGGWAVDDTGSGRLSCGFEAAAAGGYPEVHRPPRAVRRLLRSEHISPLPSSD